MAGLPMAKRHNSMALASIGGTGYEAEIQWENPMSEILATMTPRPARRWVGSGIQAVLGLLLLSLVPSMPAGAFAVQFGLFAAGGFAIYGAWRTHQATAARIELTQTELRDSTGRVLARIEDIVSIDRGTFAFKPSNGFLLRLSGRAPRQWVPGLWWRVGRFVGVGGVTPRHEAKLMGELIAGLVDQKK